MQTTLLCGIDRDAPHFAENQGDPMFTADGDPADLTQEAINLLKVFQNETNATQAVCKELETHGVLVERNINY